MLYLTGEYTIMGVNQISHFARNEKPLRISEGLLYSIEGFYPKYVLRILLLDVCFKRRMAFSLI
jgi:hypothetical protein